MEEHSDEGGSDAGVLIERFGDSLLDDGLCVSAVLRVVEAIEELSFHSHVAISQYA